MSVKRVTFAIVGTLSVAIAGYAANLALDAWEQKVAITRAIDRIEHGSLLLDLTDYLAAETRGRQSSGLRWPPSKRMSTSTSSSCFLRQRWKTSAQYFKRRIFSGTN